MLVVKLPNVFRGFGLEASSDRALSALYTLTRPVLDLNKKKRVTVSCTSADTRGGLPCGEVPPKLIAAHDAAPETALVLPSLDAPPLTDVPDVDLRVLGEAEEFGLSSLRSVRPPQGADRGVCLEPGDDLCCAGPPVDKVDVSTTACDGEDVPIGAKGADVHGAILVGAERGSPQAARRSMGSAGFKVVGVVKGTGTGEQDGGATGVEHGVRQWE